MTENKLTASNVLLIFGLVCLFAGFLQYNKIDGYVPVKAIVYNVEPLSYDNELIVVRIKYTVGNTLYKNVFTTESRSYHEGQAVSIYCDPDDPLKYEKGKEQGGFTLCFMSALAIIISLVFRIMYHQEENLQ